MAECGWTDFPRIVGVVAGQAGRPIPALPPQSLCSTPQRKCQVWPQEGAHRSQDKEIFRLSPLLPLLPFATHHDDRCALPVQQNATKCIGRRGVVTQRRDSTNVSVFHSGGRVCQAAAGGRGRVWKNSAFAGFSDPQRGAAFDTGWGRTDRNTLDDTH